MSVVAPTRHRQNWPIVYLGFLALAVCFSTRAALGLIMPVWKSELGWSASFISGVGAAALIVMALIAPFAGNLADRHGPRAVLGAGLLALSLGCAIIAATSNQYVFAFAFAGLCAIGFGFVATHVVSTAVARNFETSRGLATGMATSGSTGGQFVLVPLIAGLLTVASWRWSFAGLSLGCLALLPFVYFSLAPKAEKTVSAAGHGLTASFASDLVVILKQPTFHILFWSFFVCGFTTSGVIETHLLPFASYCGFPPMPSAAAYGFLSAVNLLGMIGSGWLTDRVNRPVLLGSIYALRGLTFVILANMPGMSIDMLFVFAALFGVVDYSTVPVTASLVSTHVGLRVMGFAMGIISGGHAVGAALGAFTGGYLFDLTGNYSILWIAALWLSLGAGLLVLLTLKMSPVPARA